MSATTPRRLASERVHERLRADVLSGRVAPGEPLPSERVLSEELGVNRHAVREAVKRLQQAGLVTVSHGGATRATAALCHGRIHEAMTLNPLAILGYALLLAYLAYSAGVMITKPGLRLRLDGVPRRTVILLRVGVGAAILANWLWVLTHLPESPWLAR